MPTRSARQASPALRGLGHTLVEGIDQNHRETGTDLRARIENRFVSDMAAKPEYSVIRIIGVADGGYGNGPGSIDWGLTARSASCPPPG